jgi:hypothetical protein
MLLAVDSNNNNSNMVCFPVTPNTHAYIIFFLEHLNKISLLVSCQYSSDVIRARWIKDVEFKYGLDYIIHSVHN